MLEGTHAAKETFGPRITTSAWGGTTMESFRAAVAGVGVGGSHVRTGLRKLFQKAGLLSAPICSVCASGLPREVGVLSMNVSIFTRAAVCACHFLHFLGTGHHLVPVVFIGGEMLCLEWPRIFTTNNRGTMTCSKKLINMDFQCREGQS